MFAMIHPPIAVCAVVLLTALSACTSQQEASISALHHFERGNRAYMNENYPSAVHHYMIALDFDERAVDVHYNLGLTYYQIQEYEMSVAAYEQALALDARRPEIHYNLALAHHKNYDLESANRHYNQYRQMAVGQIGRKEIDQRAKGRATVRNASPATAQRVQVRPSADPNRQPPRRNTGGSIKANPFQGNEKWWTEDLPTR